MKAWRGNNGFTLVELIITLAIVGIMIAMAIPSYKNMLPHMRIKAAARDIASTLNYARMSAIAKNQTVSIAFYDVASAPYPADSFYLDDNHNSLGHDWSGLVNVWWGDGTPKYNKPKFKVGDGTENVVRYTSFGRTEQDDDTDYQAVYLRNIPFAAGGEEYRVTVNRHTGKATIEQWNKVDAWVR